MPLGDPHGGNFEYTTEGLPLNVAFNVIPVSDVSRSERFYCELLGFEAVSESPEFAHLSRMGCDIVLMRSETTGIDTGIFFAVDNPYNTRRRLIDQGVVFTVEPKMGPFGTYTSFRDDDGNVISVVDAGFMKRKDAP